MKQLLLILLVLSCMPVHAQVKVGIDNLIDTDFALLKGKRVVLVTHAAARTYRGTSTLEEFLRSQEVTVTRLLTPEHGYYGVVLAGKHVLDDTILGIPAMSLYGTLRRPSKELLAGADVVVIDLQDIGVRSYTYLSTAIEVVGVCAENKVPCMVLDRPNPLGGIIVDGNVPEPSSMSFIGRIPVPYVHGMTLGELCTMANENGWCAPLNTPSKTKCSLTVVRCKRWMRSMTWEATDRSWYPTSPNIPTVSAVRGYALTGLLGELGLCCIGMGTTSPFQFIGLPGLPVDSTIIRELRNVGVGTAMGRVVPQSGKYANTVCSGFYLQPAPSWRPYQAAMRLLQCFRTLNPSVFHDTLPNSQQGKMFIKATGTPSVLKLLMSTASQQEIDIVATSGLNEFLDFRKRYLLYP